MAKYLEKRGVNEIKNEFDMFLSFSNLVYSKEDLLKQERRDVLRELDNNKELTEEEKTALMERLDEIDKMIQEVQKEKEKYEFEMPEEFSISLKVDRVLPILTLEEYEHDGETYHVAKALGEPLFAVKVIGDKLLDGEPTGDKVYAKKPIEDEEELKEIVEKGERREVYLLNALNVAYDQTGELYFFHFPQRIPYQKGREVAGRLNDDEAYTIAYKLLRTKPHEDWFMETLNRMEEQELPKLSGEDEEKVREFFYRYKEIMEKVENAVSEFMKNEKAFYDRNVKPSLIKYYLLFEERYYPRGVKKKEFEELRDRVGRDLPRILKELRDEIYAFMLKKQANLLKEELTFKDFFYKVKDPALGEVAILRSSVPDYQNPLISYREVLGSVITFMKAPDIAEGVKVKEVMRPAFLNDKLLNSYEKHLRRFTFLAGMVNLTKRVPAYVWRDVIEGKEYKEVKGEVSQEDYERAKKNYELYQKFKNSKLYKSRFDKVFSEIESLIKNVSLSTRKELDYALPIYRDFADRVKEIDQRAKKEKENFNLAELTFPERPQSDDLLRIAYARARVVEELLGLREFRKPKEVVVEEKKEVVVVNVPEEVEAREVIDESLFEINEQATLDLAQEVELQWRRER